MAHSMRAHPSVSECMWSISYEQLKELNETGLKKFGEGYSSMTMRDINREIIEPSCRRTNNSYALMLNPRGLKIDAFITHSWDEPFEAFVDSICTVFQTWIKKPNLWICAFALIQGNEQTILDQVGSRDTPLAKSPFVKALESASTFVVVRNSVTDLYSRIWCVCELMYAKRLGLYPTKTFVTGPNKFADSRTSCLDAMSSNPEDKAKILTVLLNEYRYEEIDSIVRQFRTHESPGMGGIDPNDCHPSAATPSSVGHAGSPSTPSSRVAASAMHPPGSHPAAAPPSSHAAAAPSLPSSAPVAASFVPSSAEWVILPSPLPSTTAPSAATAAAVNLSVGPAVSSSPVSSSSAAPVASSRCQEERCKIWGRWGTYIGEFNRRGERHGAGTMTWDDGFVHEGDWKKGKMDGRGTYHWPSGSVRVSKYRAGHQVGEGIWWSADRRTAQRMEDGKWEEKISLERAEEIAAKNDLPVLFRTHEAPGTRGIDREQENDDSTDNMARESQHTAKNPSPPKRLMAFTSNATTAGAATTKTRVTNSDADPSGERRRLRAEAVEFHPRSLPPLGHSDPSGSTAVASAAVPSSTVVLPSPPPSKPPTRPSNQKGKKRRGRKPPARPSSHATAPSPSPSVVSQHDAAAAAAVNLLAGPAVASSSKSSSAGSNAPTSSSSGSSALAAMAASPHPRGKRCKVNDCWGTYRGEFDTQGKPHGAGTIKWDDFGVAYTGEFKNGKMNGCGTFRNSDGSVWLSRRCANAPVGEGVELSADRRTARRYEGGRRKEEISLKRAEEIAARIGLSVPM